MVKDYDEILNKIASEPFKSAASVPAKHADLNRIGKAF